MMDARRPYGPILAALLYCGTAVLRYCCTALLCRYASGKGLNASVTDQKDAQQLVPAGSLPGTVGFSRLRKTGEFGQRILGSSIWEVSPNAF